MKKGFKLSFSYSGFDENAFRVQTIKPATLTMAKSAFKNYAVSDVIALRKEGVVSDCKVYICGSKSAVLLLMPEYMMDGIALSHCVANLLTLYDKLLDGENLPNINFNSSLQEVRFTNTVSYFTAKLTSLLKYSSKRLCEDTQGNIFKTNEFVSPINSKHAHCSFEVAQQQNKKIKQYLKKLSSSSYFLLCNEMEHIFRTHYNIKGQLTVSSFINARNMLSPAVREDTFGVFTNCFSFNLDDRTEMPRSACLAEIKKLFIETLNNNLVLNDQLNIFLQYIISCFTRHLSGANYNKHICISHLKTIPVHYHYQNFTLESLETFFLDSYHGSLVTLLSYEIDGSLIVNLFSIEKIIPQKALAQLSSKLQSTLMSISNES